MKDKLLQKGKGTFYISKVKTKDKDGFPLQTSNKDRKVMLIVDVEDSNGDETVIFEHLTLKSAWKVKTIYEACNKGDLFLSNDNCLDNLDELEGERGECLLDIREAQNGYPEQTVIKKYKERKVPTKTQVANTEVASYDGLDQDIPF